MIVPAFNGLISILLSRDNRKNRGTSDIVYLTPLSSNMFAAANLTLFVLVITYFF